MFGTLPIFVALIAQAFGLERLHFRHWIATVISFSGVALVRAGASSGISGDLGGILLGLVASVTWAAYSVAMGPLMRRYSPYRISAFMLLVGSRALSSRRIRQLGEQDWSELSGLAWACFVYSLFFSLVFTNIMWFTAIDRVGRRARLPLREPAAFPRRVLRARRALRGDGRAPDRRRARDRRRDPARPASRRHPRRAGLN